VGAYVSGSNAQIDDALAHIDGINGFLRQAPREVEPFDSMLAALQKVLK
jgi:flagellar biosynthesis/type III secretory pathway ATPase